MWLIVPGIMMLAAIAAGPIMSNVEQAKYSVVEQSGAIEIRDYDRMIIAETRVEGRREDAIREGFWMVADYIFGNNTAAQKVAMTAPVIQQSREKIAMTAPVIQQGTGQHWQVSFVMPASYTMATLPRPNNPSVTVKEVPAKRYAAIRFSGSADAELLSQQQQALEAFIAAHHLKTRGEPTFAFFNPPWTLPALRRNEVMIELQQ